MFSSEKSSVDRVGAASSTPVLCSSEKWRSQAAASVAVVLCLILSQIPRLPQKNTSSLLLPWTNWESEREMLLKFTRNRTHSSENSAARRKNEWFAAKTNSNFHRTRKCDDKREESVSRLTRQMRQNIWQILFFAYPSQQQWGIAWRKWKGSSCSSSEDGSRLCDTGRSAGAQIEAEHDVMRSLVELF